MFWSWFDQLGHDLAPKNRQLLAERDRLQAELDNWYRQNPGPITNAGASQDFLRQIGYLKDVPANVAVKTSKVDTEITQQPGPPLVVPITTATYDITPPNAPWGRLYKPRTP